MRGGHLPFVFLEMFMKSTLKLLGKVYMFEHHYKIDSILKLIKYYKIKDVFEVNAMI